MIMDELFDSMILDCNNAVKMLFDGNFISWCGVMKNIASKLIKAKEQVQKEIKDRDEKIATLERFIKDLNDGGADNGAE